MNIDILWSYKNNVLIKDLNSPSFDSVPLFNFTPHNPAFVNTPQILRLNSLAATWSLLMVV